MFKKPKKTDEPIVDIQEGETNSTLDDGFSEDVKKYDTAPQKKKKQAALSKKQRTVITVISCVLAVLLLFTGSLFLFPAFYFSNATALTVNGMKIPVYEYNFTYWTNVQYFVQAYGSIFTEDVLDATKDLSKQQCPSTLVGDVKMSWQDYFLEDADRRMESMMIAYQKGVDMGMELTESDQNSIDNFFKIIKQYADQNGVTEEEFIDYMFGTSCSKENLRIAQEHIYIAESYNDYLFESYQVEQTELDDWMTEFKDQFWGACYNYYSFKATSTDENSIRTAKQKAHEFLDGVTDQASFAALAYKSAPEEKKEDFASSYSTLRYYFTADEISDSDISTWLFDESRKPGDKEVIYSVTDGTAYALYFVDADFPPTKASNLFSIYLGIGDKYADQSAAQAAAQAVQAKFIEGGKTAEAFSALAEEYSDDPEVKDDGGLNKNFIPKKMDQEVAIWCYTTNRAEGDYTIIESSYGGYYFVWLESWGDPVWQVTAIDDIKNYHFDLSQDELLKDIQSEPTFFRAFMVSK